MATPLVMVWLGFVSIVGLNAIAAGAAVVLYAWRRGLWRGSRTFLAGAIAGFLSASWLISIAALGSPEELSEQPWAMAVAFAVIFAVATALFVPGAVLVARKLEKPGDDYRAFE